MTPIRAIIVGPPSPTTSTSASIAACHSGVRLLLGKRRDIVRRVAQGDELAVRQGDRLVKLSAPA
jgi:hypothetical protein